MCPDYELPPALRTEKIPDTFDLDDECAICNVSFRDILEGDGGAGGIRIQPQEDNVEDRVGMKALTKLEGCGHVFCSVE